MQKAERTFDPSTGRILPDLSKKETKMNAISENGAEKRTKGNKVVMTFLNEKGEPAKSPQEGCRGVHAQLIESGNTDFLDLRSLVNPDGTPADMLFRLAAFGASTLGRNEVNTVSEEDGGATQGEANLLGRWEGFRQNSYRSISTGSATPIILLALERTLLADGRTEESVSASVAKWRAKYDAADIMDEKAQGKARREVIKDLRAVVEIREAEKAIQAEREAARIARAPAKSLADI